jgi:hypothetical protein
VRWARRHPLTYSYQIVLNSFLSKDNDGAESRVKVSLHDRLVMSLGKPRPLSACILLIHCTHCPSRLTMPIRLLIEHDHSFGPDEIANLVAGF